MDNIDQFLSEAFPIPNDNLGKLLYALAPSQQAVLVQMLLDNAEDFEGSHNVTYHWLIERIEAYAENDCGLENFNQHYRPFAEKLIKGKTL